jgi:hypothetical protein
MKKSDVNIWLQKNRQKSISNHFELARTSLELFLAKPVNWKNVWKNGKAPAKNFFTLSVDALGDAVSNVFSNLMDEYFFYMVLEHLAVQCPKSLNITKVGDLYSRRYFEQLESPHGPYTTRMELALYLSDLTSSIKNALMDDALFHFYVKDSIYFVSCETQCEIFLTDEPLESEENDLTEEITLSPAVSAIKDYKNISEEQLSQICSSLSQILWPDTDQSNSGSNPFSPRWLLNLSRNAVPVLIFLAINKSIDSEKKTLSPKSNIFYCLKAAYTALSSDTATEERMSDIKLQQLQTRFLLHEIDPQWLRAAGKSQNAQSGKKAGAFRL